MSLFKNLSVEEALKVVEQDLEKIKLIEIEGGEERSLLINLIKHRPLVFLSLDEKQICTDVVVEFIKHYPAYYLELPKSAKNDTVRLEILKINPTLIDLFDVEDITYAVVKFLYQNYPPFMLEEFEPEIQAEVDKLIAQLQSENVERKYSTIDEIDAEEDEE